MVRDRYNRELASLKQKVVTMGEISQKTIVDSVEALRTLDIELARETIERDKLIDNYEMYIERCATRLLAHQQPLARDLRLITSSIKIAIDLERMSDLAVNIAEITEKIEGDHVKPLVDIPKMAVIAENMVKNAIKAFDTSDLELAKLAASEDDKIDSLFSDVWLELIGMMIEDPAIIKNASHLLFVLRYLERIGDHASNICESVVYMASGERVELN
ncbi:MAG: phosphate signaling complex protein PhoU [Methanosarcinaceae archaeon]|nr:phosphate signaling complex protein PhoU [Methanosarcinaceae archaeon]